MPSIHLSKLPWGDLVSGYDLYTRFRDLTPVSLMGTFIPWVNPSSLVGGMQGPLSLGGSSPLARNGTGRMETKYSKKSHLRSNELVPSAKYGLR